MLPYRAITFTKLFTKIVLFFFKLIRLELICRDELRNSINFLFFFVGVETKVFPFLLLCALTLNMSTKYSKDKRKKKFI